MCFPIIPSGSKLPNLLPKIREASSNGRWKEVFSHYQDIKKTRVQLIDHAVFSHILKACLGLSFSIGKSVHVSLIKQGFISFTSVGNSLMDFYAKSGALDSTMGVFNCIKSKDSVSWNIIVHSHLERGVFEEGLKLLSQARRAEFDPNISTLLLIIQAYQSLRAFDDGLRFHGYLIQSGLWSLISVQNSLLNMYTGIGMEHAEKLFEEIYEKDVISWSVMIRCYAHSDEFYRALDLFNQMVSEFGIEADGQTMVSILKGCTNLGDIRMGKSIHGFIFLRGFNYDLFVGNTLIDFYCKCTDVDSAVKAFSEMPQRNLVSWNSMLCGFVHNERHSEALRLFDLMGKSRVEADEVTLVNLLQMCKVLGDLSGCKLVHSKVIQKDFQYDELPMNSLIDAYAKCNQINYAQRLFCQIKRPDAVTWGTMISGFTHCGMPEEAISIFREMQTSLEHPTPVTLLNLLEACALSAELKRSKCAHGITIRMGLAWHVVLGTAIVDMYSKCGAIEASKRAFDQISNKNVVSWSAIIAACALNGLPHDALALLYEMKVHDLKPNAVTILSVLSACCHGGLVEEGLSVFIELATNHGAELKLEHYSCLVDLLARSGNIDKALDMIKSIPVGMKTSASAWSAILSACRNYENREFAAGAFSQILELEPSSSGGYLLASSLYAAGGSWTDACGIRCLVKERGVQVVSGYSLMYISNKAYSFTAGDKHHPLSCMLCPVLEQLHWCMKMDMGEAPLLS